MFDLKKIQNYLRQEGKDAWLFYNFHNIDPSANAILDIPPQAILTRRWFYLVPAQGEPSKLVHKIEKGALDHLPGSKREYAMWKQLHDEINGMLASCRHICMQYSPMNAIPYVSFVDAGTIELVRTTGVTIHSSANLIQEFEAIWSKDGLECHLVSAEKLHKLVELTFAYVREQIKQGAAINEYQVQQFMVGQFRQMNMVFSDPPIVAVNEHSGNPHYEPMAQGSAPIKQGDLLLLDLWAKENKPEAVYADITWVGVVDKKLPDEPRKVFGIVRDARDAATKLVMDRFAAGKEIAGFEVDDAARSVIQKAGYGDYFVHRTGHSIGKEVHWKGVNMDNFETKDERKLIDGIGFSIEPGIYLNKFGIRSELNIYIAQGKPHVSGQPIQQELIPILA